MHQPALRVAAGCRPCPPGLVAHRGAALRPHGGPAAAAGGSRGACAQRPGRPCRRRGLALAERRIHARLGRLARERAQGAGSGASGVGCRLPASLLAAESGGTSRLAPSPSTAPTDYPPLQVDDLRGRLEALEDSLREMEGRAVAHLDRSLQEKVLATAGACCARCRPGERGAPHRIPPVLLRITAHGCLPASWRCLRVLQPR